jgi:transcriptional regulator with XRE-family HTH domain
MTNNNIGNILRKLRDDKRFTAKKAVNCLYALGFNISEKTLYGYENGIRMPNSDLFMALCTIYEVEDVLGKFGYKDLKNAVLFNNEEWELLEHFRIFNKAGQEKITNYMIDLKATGLYTDIEISNTATATANISKEEPPHLLPVAAHNDFANDEDEQRLMREDLNEL